MKITVALGTRPEIVKLAPVVAALRAAGHDVRTIATGQHADPRLAGQFFADLGFFPDTAWQLPDDEGARVGALLSAGFAEFAARQADAVVVLGDTYTAPLVAMAARRFGIGVIHVEAGLRSANEKSMEEIHRRMMPALATVHFAPTTLAAECLRQEGVAPERIRVVGNPVIDAVVASGVSRVPWQQRSGVLLTAHRAGNVDDPQRLAELVALVRALGRRSPPVVFPVHPRTRSRLVAAGRFDELAHADGVRLVEPLPYRELLQTLAASRIVVTDSGGLQEEAAWLGVPVVVLRTTTPRWEGVRNGSAVLTGMDAARALDAAARLTDPAEAARIDALPCPYGDGRTGPRIAAALADPEFASLIPPREPELGDGEPAFLAKELT
ncbi:MAG: UDP-N-acetylglucosamine 2-epimerase (non-hydrolyzing) [Acidothermus cellulolyticus]|nr:UDP-N-acetylglucosamine 2-epimerase (non-hydrolyzing) [Acidothermus cellulolyticus]